MSGFVFLRGKYAEEAEAKRCRHVLSQVYKQKCMREVGFFKFGDILLLVYQRDRDHHLLYTAFENGDFVCIVGSALNICNQKPDLLRAVHDDLCSHNSLPKDLSGSFVVIALIRNVIHIESGCNGLIKVYSTSDTQAVSTSLVALRKLVSSVTISKQELFEYILCGTVYGAKTVFHEISVLESRKTHVFHNDSYHTFDKPPEPPISPNRYSDLKSNVTRVSEDLRQIFSKIKSCYGNQLAVPITGGFDSRLICACVNQAGIRPDFCFVLHKDHQKDIDIAKKIAKALKWDLVVLDNDFNSWEKGKQVNILKNQYYSYDGLGIGGILQVFSGMDAYARIPPNHLLLDGNGGEIFRNIHRLPNRPMKLRDYVLKTFLKKIPSFSQPAFNMDEFIYNVSDKISSIMRYKGKTSPRHQLEAIFPYFSLKYWLAENFSVANQFTDIYSPFSDPELVRRSLMIPSRFKQLGFIEAKVIENISPDLASIDSNYGYDFRYGMTIARRIKESLIITLANSPLVNYKKALKRHKTKSNLPFYAKSAYLSTMKDAAYAIHGTFLDTMVTEQYVDFQLLNSADQISRLISVELLAQDVF